MIYNLCNLLSIFIIDIIKEEVGKGTFGKVFKCKDTKHNDNVALKMVRSVKRYIKSAKIEAEILDYVYKKQKEYNKNFCVKMFSHFKYDG
jgi:serine/threonine protein kinase